ncbi:MAG: carboxypeptidase-like regulatory domain-containing protein [Lewinellaceae bacterium]|nr:carboxypeptidase-like regulatory domain-containing protein [Lewinellaceae bacterium]
MKRSFPILALLLCTCQMLLAQTPSRITIKGTAKDTLENILAYATVMLLNPKDTTLANFTRSDDKGAFSFKNVKNTPYLLKISYIGYLPFQLHLPVSEKETNDLGVLRNKPISNELMEVVIKTAKAPLRIHGDTIEYDATTFKVPKKRKSHEPGTQRRIQKRGFWQNYCRRRYRRTMGRQGQLQPV